MFAVLHLADFALQALLCTEFGSVGHAVALLDTTTRPPRLIACTAPARARGVEPGQTSPQALARCERLRILTPRADAEAEAAAGLLATAFSVTPLVEVTAPGVCTLQIGGVASERRESELRRALADLRALGLHATAGAGPTPLLALYAARHAEPLFIIGDERRFLAPLPLAAAEPPAELIAILAGWGLRTLGDLTALPKAAVAQRLGPPGLALWERAAGEATRPLNLVTPPPRFSAALACEHELETLEPVLFVLRRFVDRLAIELNTASLAAAELVFALTLADETTLTRTLRLPEPSTQADTLFRALQTHLETVRTQAGVVGVRLDITPIRAAAPQHGLFDRALRDPHRFAETLARIAALVGGDRVGTPVLRDTHRPDAFTLTPPPAEIPPRDERIFRPAPQGLVLRRYRSPLPATVELGGQAGGAPAYVRTSWAEGAVLAASGPWRSAGDWWQPDQIWEREEWDVEIDGLYRLVSSAGRWFVEGEYD